ncbi:MAG: site-specific DNA-methyltransferase, partial [Verrucomicrobiota bacterium]
VAFEVGDVRQAALEDAVARAGLAAGLPPRLLLINAQDFTKTAHCWGVDNRSKGTNTNRILLLERPSR